jgi:hypothetical protein
MRGERFESIRCSRCQHELRATSNKKKAANITAGGSEPAEEVLPSAKPAAATPSPAPEIDDQSLAEFRSEIHRIDKIVSMWGEAKYLRFDSEHQARFASQRAEETPVDATQPIRLQPKIEINKPNVLATCLMMGGALAVALGAFHGSSLSNHGLPRDLLVAAGFAGAGIMGIVTGLLFEVGRLKRAMKELL